MISYTFFKDTNVGEVTDNYENTTLQGRLSAFAIRYFSAALTYPALASGITVAKDAGAWAAMPASKTEIIPASTITSPFDLHFLHTNSISANGEYLLNLYKGAAGAEVLICQIPISRTLTFSNEGTQQITTAVLPANTRISASLSGSTANADSIIIKLMYHTY